MCASVTVGRSAGCHSSFVHCRLRYCFCSPVCAPIIAYHCALSCRISTAEGAASEKRWHAGNKRTKACRLIRGDARSRLSLNYYIFNDAALSLATYPMLSGPGKIPDTRNSFLTKIIYSSMIPDTLPFGKLASIERIS